MYIYIRLYPDEVKRNKCVSLQRHKSRMFVRLTNLTKKILTSKKRKKIKVSSN